MSASLWEAFCHTVARYPNKDALVHGTTRLTFATWKERSLSYVSWFRARGGKRGDRVLLLMEPSAEMAAAMLGIWGAGGIVVLLDPTAPLPRILHAMEICDPRLILSSRTKHPMSVDVTLSPDVPNVKKTENLGLLPSGTEAASILFTSGSTGRPKGVTQSHGNLARGAKTVGSYLGLSADDRILCAIPWSFDYGFMQLHSAATFGATLILPNVLSPTGICDAISEHHPTVLPGLPSFFSYLMMDGLSPFRKINLSSIHTVTNTGGTIPEPVLQDLLVLFPVAKVF